MCTNESLNNKHDIRIKWVKKFVLQAIQALENLVLPRLTGGLQKLDFLPFPVFLKLSHTPELSWEIDNLSVRKQNLILNANGQASPTNLE